MNFTANILRKIAADVLAIAREYQVEEQTRYGIAMIRPTATAPSTVQPVRLGLG